MTDPTKFQQYLQLVDRLVEIADKEQLAECARLLALNVAHYEICLLTIFRTLLFPPLKKGGRGDLRNAEYENPPFSKGEATRWRFILRIVQRHVTKCSMK